MRAILWTLMASSGMWAFAPAAGSEEPAPPGGGDDPARRLPISVYVDRMKGGWIGQMIGVGWAGPTEFRSNGAILSEEAMPPWHPELINQFHQDDLYVEMTFLKTLEDHGLDVPIRQAGLDFARSGYPLWHANDAGRTNLRAGIAPPDSGHPQFNKHADDIDYQIEADYSGLIAPGMPRVVVDLGETFGRLMNYGDGLYAGQFLGALYAEAFFTDDRKALIESALTAIPAESGYAGMVRDVLAWYREHPDDWQATWRRVEERYHRDPASSHGLCSGPGGVGDFSIDVKLNGAYVLIGLLHGDGDLEKTIRIATRCGQDSDCNPSSAAGVLATTIGFARLPERFTSALDPSGTFSHTPYDFPKLVAVCERLARQAVDREGGRVETDAEGAEVFVIPRRRPEPTALERSHEPGPIQGVRYTDEEMAALRDIPTGN